MSDSYNLTVAVICFATGVLSSAAYFDYQRRNAPQEHPRGRKSRKRLIPSLSQGDAVVQAGFPSGVISPKLLREALLQVKQEESPTTSEYKESYFVTQVNVGELLATQGPAFHLSAAIAFFKALRMHPMPMDLVMIYQKYVPEPIFKASSYVTGDAKFG